MFRSITFWWVQLYCKQLRIKDWYIFFNCYLAAPRPTLGHYRGDSFTLPMLIIAFFTFSTQRTFRFLQQRLNPLGHHCHPQQIKRLSNTTLVLYYSQSVIMENSCISNICRTNRWFVLVYCMQIVIMKNLLRSPKTV